MSKFPGPIVCGDLHPYEKDCFMNVAIVFTDSFINGLKIYAPLMLVPAVFTRRSLNHIATRTLLDIIRSAAFLGSFASSFAGYMCIFRRFLPKSNRFMMWICGFLSGWTSILIERKNRRSELALYCVNQAAEILFKMMQSRGWVRSRKNGEVAIFSIASAVLMYFYQNEPENLRSNIKGVLTKLLGTN